MAKPVTIKLIDPLEWHQDMLTSVDLREPTGRQYVELGEPRVLVRLADGGGYWIEQPSAITAYLERCIVHEGGVDLLNRMSLADAMNIKGELLGFFITAAAKEPKGKPTT